MDIRNNWLLYCCYSLILVLYFLQGRMNPHNKCMSETLAGIRASFNKPVTHICPDPAIKEIRPGKGLEMREQDGVLTIGMAPSTVSTAQTTPQTGPYVSVKALGADVCIPPPDDPNLITWHQCQGKTRGHHINYQVLIKDPRHSQDVEVPIHFFAHLDNPEAGKVSVDHYPYCKGHKDREEETCYDPTVVEYYSGLMKGLQAETSNVSLRYGGTSHTLDGTGELHLPHRLAEGNDSRWVDQGTDITHVCYENHCEQKAGGVSSFMSGGTSSGCKLGEGRE